jgi:hypothetical protein
MNSLTFDPIGKHKARLVLTPDHCVLCLCEVELSGTWAQLRAELPKLNAGDRAEYEASLAQAEARWPRKNVLHPA